MKKLLLCGIATTMLLGCSETIETRGNFIDSDRMNKIEIADSSRLDVINTWGTPTTVAPFDDRKWFYIGEKVELGALSQYDLVERKVIAIAFDDEWKVAAIETLDENDAQYIESVERETPTAGKELNALQQMIGNIGKFNANQMQPRN